MAGLEHVVLEGQVGPQAVSDGASQSIRQGRGAELIVADLHGKYAEQSRRKNIFFAASQAATTWSVALNTTHTGFVVYNPAGSGKVLSILQASFALSAAPVAITTVGLFGGGNSAGIATHTTALTVYNGFLSGSAGSAGADGAATLVGTPVWIHMFLGGFTAGALFATTPSILDVNGSITVPPGYYCGIGSLTAAVGFASMMWEEITE